MQKIPFIFSNAGIAMWTGSSANELAVAITIYRGAVLLGVAPALCFFGRFFPKLLIAGLVILALAGIYELLARKSRFVEARDHAVAICVTWPTVQQGALSAPQALRSLRTHMDSHALGVNNQEQKLIRTIARSAPELEFFEISSRSLDDDAKRQQNSVLVVPRAAALDESTWNPNLAKQFSQAPSAATHNLEYGWIHQPPEFASQRIVVIHEWRLFDRASQQLALNSI